MKEQIVGIWEKGFFMGKDMSGYFFIINEDGTLIRKWGKMNLQSNWDIITKDNKPFLVLTNKSRQEYLEIEILKLTDKEFNIPSHGQIQYMNRRDKIS